ncbi:MAG: hypothetical protein AAF614_00720 [Chloroflexota bacterium]
MTAILTQYGRFPVKSSQPFPDKDCNPNSSAITVVVSHLGDV